MSKYLMVGNVIRTHEGEYVGELIASDALLLNQLLVQANKSEALIAENEQLRGALIEVRDSFAKVDAECFAATIWAIDAAMSKGGQGDEG